MHCRARSGMRLRLGCGTKTYGVSYDSDGVAGGETGEAAGHARCEVDEAGVEGIGRIGGHGADDEDRDDEAVDGDDSGHDDGDERLARRVSRCVLRSAN